MLKKWKSKVDKCWSSGKGNTSEPNIFGFVLIITWHISNYNYLVTKSRSYYCSSFKENRYCIYMKFVSKITISTKYLQHGVPKYYILQQLWKYSESQWHMCKFFQCHIFWMYSEQWWYQIHYTNVNGNMELTDCSLWNRRKSVDPSSHTSCSKAQQVGKLSW